MRLEESAQLFLEVVLHLILLKKNWCVVGEHLSLAGLIRQPER